MDLDVTFSCMYRSVQNWGTDFAVEQAAPATTYVSYARAQQCIVCLPSLKQICLPYTYSVIDSVYVCKNKPNVTGTLPSEYT
jgi:hypothetical protein